MNSTKGDFGFYSLPFPDLFVRINAIIYFACTTTIEVNPMSFKAKKYLAIFLLLVSVACAPVKPRQFPDRTISSSQPYLASQINTPYPETVKPSTIVSSTETLQPGTSTYSPSPSLSSPISEQKLSNLRISRLQMFDANAGWAIYTTPFILPENVNILRTNKGIQTWVDVTPPISESNSDIWAAYFVDATSAVVISSRSSLSEPSTVEIFPWRTTQGGHNWQVGEILQIDHASEFYPRELSFISKEHGWMLGESDSGMQNMRVHLFETQDGGMHMEMVYDSINHLSDPDTLWIKGYYPYTERFTFISGDVGFFSDGRLFISQDGGRVWKFHPLDPPADLPEIDCQDGNCKYLDTISAPLFTSAQDGVLIRRAYLNSDTVMDFFVYYPNTLNRLPLPTAQYLYFSHDGGQSWIPKPLPLRIGTVYFFNAEIGWLIGKNDPDPAVTTQLFQTTDGGETWNKISGDTPLPLGIELQFVDEENGFAFYPVAVTDYYKDFDVRIDQTPQPFFTRDGGRSWTKVKPQVIP
ncbi:MAG: hypothetical protein P8Z00_19845 [Anaerolineales bacterium]